MEAHLGCQGGHPVLQRAEAGPPEVSEDVLDVALLQVGGVDRGLVPRQHTVLHTDNLAQTEDVATKYANIVRSEA